MTDIHSHILFDIDDGFSSILDSLDLLAKLKNVGFDNIILTPHYIENSEYNADNHTKLLKFNELKRECKKNNIDINLYLGNEVFINDHIKEGILDKQIYPLNNGKYLLFELPLNNQILNLLDIIHEIKIQGYIPVLAHPERYTYFQKDYSLVDELKKENVLFQVNYASILDYYGKKAKKLLKYILKNHYVDFLGTDIHPFNKDFIIDNFSKIEKNLIKVCGVGYYQEIINNGDMILKKEI